MLLGVGGCEDHLVLCQLDDAKVIFINVSKLEDVENIGS